MTDGTADDAPLVFDALGQSIPLGADFAQIDLTVWPCARKIWAPWLPEAPTLLTVILRGSAGRPLPDDVAARCIAAVDWGVAVELLARDDAELDAAIGMIAPWLGGGHA